MTESDAIRRQLEMYSDERLIEILRDRECGQWRPEVYEIVAAILESRGVSTGALLAQAAEDAEANPDELFEVLPEDLFTVAEYLDPVEADADRVALEQAGLRAWVAGDNIDAAEGIISKLRVRREDWPAAMDILRAPTVSASDLPPELSGLQCPKCGSSDVEEEAEELDVLDSSSSSLSASRRKMWLYRCASCKHTWSG